MGDGSPGGQQLQTTSTNEDGASAPPLAAQPLGQQMKDHNIMSAIHQPPYDKLGGDQWEAWREIQMQNDQMQALEDQLRNACGMLNVNAGELFQMIDASLIHKI